MSTNIFSRLQALLPPSPVLIAKVITVHSDDTSTVRLPINSGDTQLSPGLAQGRLLRVRGSQVPAGANAFVRDGLIESRAPDGDPVLIVIGDVNPTPPITRLLATNGTIPNQTLSVGAVYPPLSISQFWKDGFPPITYSYTGTLAPGLTFNAAAGLISGTPTTVGSYVLTLTATDSTGRAVAQNPVTFTVSGDADWEKVMLRLTFDNIATAQTLLSLPLTSSPVDGIAPTATVTLNDAGAVSFGASGATFTLDGSNNSITALGAKLTNEPSYGDYSASLQVDVVGNAGTGDTIRFMIIGGGAREYGFAFRCISNVRTLTLYAYISSDQSTDYGPMPASGSYRIQLSGTGTVRWYLNDVLIRTYSGTAAVGSTTAHIGPYNGNQAGVTSMVCRNWLITNLSPTTTLQDKSTYASTATISSGASISASAGKWGAGGYAATRYAPAVGAFAEDSPRFRTTDSDPVTVEFWFYNQSLANITTSANYWEWRTPSQRLAAIAAYANAGEIVYYPPSGSVSLGTHSLNAWHFLQYTYDGTGGTGALKIDIDGVEVYSANGGHSTPGSGTHSMRVGGWNNNDNSYSAVYRVDDFRYTKGVARPRGAVPTEPFPDTGPPPVPTAPPVVIGYTEQDSGGAADITVPAHLAGDMVLLFLRSSSTTPPAVPSGWEAVIDCGTVAYQGAWRIVSFIDAAGTLATISTSLATHMWGVVVRGAEIGAVGTTAEALSGGSFTPWTAALPTLSLDAPGSAIVLGGANTNQGDTLSAPSAMTELGSNGSPNLGGGMWAVWDSDAAESSFTGRTTGAANGCYFSLWAIELKGKPGWAGPPPPPETFVTIIGYAEQSTAPGDLTIPTHVANDLIVLFLRSDTTTPPSTPGGWTSRAVSNTTIGKGWRVVSRVDTTNTVATVAQAVAHQMAAVVVRNATIGAVNTTSGEAIGDWATLPFIQLAGTTSKVLAGVSLDQSTTAATPVLMTLQGTNESPSLGGGTWAMWATTETEESIYSFSGRQSVLGAVAYHSAFAIELRKV